MGRVSLSFDPYAYVRTAVMRSLLFKRGDFDKLQKMGFNEIARFLQDSKYGAQINALGVEYSGAELLTRAVDRNYVEEISKLHRICNEDVLVVIDAYLLRKDVWNLKTILRGKFSDVSKEEIQSMLHPVGQLTKEALDQILSKDDIEDILNHLPLIGDELRKKSAEQYHKDKNLLEVENILDKFYYTSVLEFSRNLPRAGKTLKDFFFSEVDVLNLLSVFRLKKDNADAEAVDKCYLGEGHLKKGVLDDILKAKDKSAIVKILKDTAYVKPIEETYNPEGGSLLELETALNHFVLEKSLKIVRRDPMSPNVIIGYLFMKENEVRNLQVLIKGKQLGLEDDFIGKQLVVL